jgi:hypothetical protein
MADVVWLGFMVLLILTFIPVMLTGSWPGDWSRWWRQYVRREATMELTLEYKVPRGLHIISTSGSATIKVDAAHAAEIPTILRALADQVEAQLRTTFPLQPGAIQGRPVDTKHL